MTQARLRSLVWRVDVDLDPVAVAGEHGVLWARDGFALAGRGAARMIESQSRDGLAGATHAALAGIVVESELERRDIGPVAMGALPFDRDAAANLVVPEVCYGRDRDGTRWLCWTGAAGAAVPAPGDVVAGLVADEVQPADGPTSFAVAPSRPADEWCRDLIEARDELRRGAARKVVLARDVRIACNGPVARSPILARLVRSYPTCFLFSMPTLVGASPELLVSRRGDVVRSQPMAGTTRRSPDPAVDARLAAGLLGSEKDRIEHQITIDMVHDTLLPWCSYLDAETAPQVVSVANVHHLATAVEGRLSRPLPSVLDLVHALHPTPAVCGDPRDEAAELIAKYERMDRGSYAAPVGWVDRDGNGEWAVGVRSAEITGSTARLFAGVGVVAESDPDAELDETRVKLEAMLGAIVRP